MKDILIQQETQLEPLTTLAQLAQQFGNLDVLAALTALFELEVQQDSCCLTCLRKAQFWHRKLADLLEQYDEDFPPREAVIKVNHPLSGIVQ
jgi:hypothetical protein